MYKAGILGGAGYSGIELLRILQKHSNVEVTAITSNTYKGRKVSDIYPEFRESCDLIFESMDIERIVNQVEVVFLALPARVAMESARLFLDQGKIVIDLSGAFRLKDTSQYKIWYGMDHTEEDLLSRAVYGLSELYREEISGSRFISNPGCYPTGVLLGLAPVLEQGLVDMNRIIVDAKSGVTGKGRSMDPTSHFCELNEDLFIYKLSGHQHVPEMVRFAGALSGKGDPHIVFAPQVMPVNRGILANTFCSMKKTINPSALRDIYVEQYGRETFVRVLEEGVLPRLSAVTHSNYCDISLTLNGNDLIITTVIDNLQKGAAGQAVQNFNILTGQNEEEGLLP